VAITTLSEHLANFAAPGIDGVVFTGSRGGPLWRAELSTEWRVAVARVASAPSGLHVHDLRHAAATMIARMPGVTTKELMSRIGHSSPRAALIYQHATAERDQAIADYLDEQVAAAKAASASSWSASVVPLRRT
jgi:integrase